MGVTDLIWPLPRQTRPHRRQLLPPPPPNVVPLESSCEATSSTSRPREAYQVKLRAESLITESSTGSFEQTPLQTSLVDSWPPADQIHSKISTIPDNFQEQINKRPLRSKAGSYPPMLLQHGHSCYPRKRTQMQAFLTGRHQIRDVLVLYEWKRRVSSCPEC